MPGRYLIKYLCFLSDVLLQNKTVEYILTYEYLTKFDCEVHR